MTGDSIRIRDRLQFELKLGYPVWPDDEQARYMLDIYLYLPPSLGVTRANYSKSDFYDDLHAYVRMKTPSVPLEEIVPSASGPLSWLSAAALRIRDYTNPAHARRFEYQVKLFCCVLKSSLRDYVDALQANANQDERLQGIRRYCKSISGVRIAFRDLNHVIDKPDTDDELVRIYGFADEYMSLLIEEHTYRILEVAKERGWSLEPALRTKLLDLVRSEIAHRRERGFPSIPNDRGENEVLLYRRNVLKKFMSNVLFLRTRTEPSGKFLRETLLGVAAGVAMLFATAVLFLSQSVYGPLTAPVFVALVVSYIFKDRIKELLRLQFSRRLSPYLFDHKTDLYAGLKDRIGCCKESIDFIDIRKVPASIERIRNRDHMTEIEGAWVGETVIQYRRHIELQGDRIAELYDQVKIEGINDILRLNVADIMKRTGRPQKPVFTLSGDDYRVIQADRVYHLNMILRCVTPDGTTLRRFRIVLNRDGIKRIDNVSFERETATARRTRPVRVSGGTVSGGD